MRNDPIPPNLARQPRRRTPAVQPDDIHALPGTPWMVRRTRGRVGDRVLCWVFLEMNDMGDRELLEMAAKAAGIADLEWSGTDDRFEYPVEHKGGTNYFTWNPLTDDGDALRLAVKLKLDVVHGDEHVFVGNVLGDYWKASECTFNTDPSAATRRAIVRAAAEIGKGMP